MVAQWNTPVTVKLAPNQNMAESSGALAALEMSTRWESGFLLTVNIAQSTSSLTAKAAALAMAMLAGAMA